MYDKIGREVYRIESGQCTNIHTYKKEIPFTSSEYTIYDEWMFVITMQYIPIEWVVSVLISVYCLFILDRLKS